MSATELVQTIYRWQELDFQVHIVCQRLATQDDEEYCAECKLSEFSELHMWSVNSLSELWYVKKIYVSQDEKLRYEIYQRHHDDMLAEHFRLKCTIKLLHQIFNWSDCRKNIQEYCWTCISCQLNKSMRHKLYDELTSLSVSSQIWKNIIMNFIMDLLSSVTYSEGTYNVIWVVIDCLSKMIHYVFVCKTIDASMLAELFIQKVICLHELLNSIVSNWETIFIFKFWSSFCFYLNVRWKLSTAFHSQTDE